MPHLAKGSDGSAHDRFPAKATNTLQQFQVIWIAVQMSFVFVAISSLYSFISLRRGGMERRRGGEGGRRRGEEGGANPEFTIALLAPEVFRMHALAVEGDVLAYDGLLALATDAS